VPIYFLDSSALVKAYRREAGTPRVLELLNGTEPLVISRLAHPEVAAAIVRRGRQAGISTQDQDVVLEELDREISQSFEVIELTASVMDLAVEMTRRHGLRGADAIQLACAVWTSQLHAQAEIVLVGGDLELNAAGRLEGLSIFDPTI
jgi:predicted nucleic acid-binding protein